MNSKLRFAAALGALFVFAARNTRAVYGAAPTDTCSLLTPAQVSAALGVPVVGKSLGPKVCFWSQAGAKPGSTLRKVDLVILVTEGYTLAKTPNSRTSVTPASGLGDDAYYFAMTSGQYMELRVKKGSIVFGIRVHRSGTPFTTDQIKAKEKALAQEVLAKL